LSVFCTERIVLSNCIIQGGPELLAVFLRLPVMGLDSTLPRRFYVYALVDCRCIITHSLRARDTPECPKPPIYDAPLAQGRAIKNRIQEGAERRNQEKLYDRDVSR
jgi:hypothetical protein